MKRTEIIDGKITCGKCKETKELKYFCKRPENDSYRGKCKKCSKGYKLSQQDKLIRTQELFSIGLRECSKCKTLQSLEEFSVDKHTKYGITSNCKTCIRARVNPGSKNRSLLYKYKIDLTQFKQMIVDQNNQCAICKTSLENMDVKSIHTDHCHTTGKVRGILCKHCNFGLGWFKDDTELLENAITYLKLHAND